MQTLLIAVATGIAFIIAYHTYGRWLGRRIFNLAADNVCPSHRLRDDNDYVPTSRFVVFGHHFTSIAATGPIVGPAIAVIWGWLPALLWVVLGSIFIGAVHDLGALAVSLRNNGQTVGDIAGRVLNRRVRILFLCVLFLALTIIIAIFGLVIANVFRFYPAAIFPCLVQIPLAVLIGFWLHRQGVNLIIPSLLALSIMYLTVILGDTNFETSSAALSWVMTQLHAFNETLAQWSIITWVVLLLVYAYIASVLPVWTLLQPRDFINALQLVGTLALIVAGLVWAAFMGGAPPVEGATRQPLEIAAPMVNWNPEGAPLLVPFLFITIACGAISGFHCLVSSGTSSKQLNSERDAQFVGYGSMLAEGFLATIVILACVAGLGLGVPLMSGAVPVAQIHNATPAASTATSQPSDVHVTGTATIETQSLTPGATLRAQIDVESMRASEVVVEKDGAWTLRYKDVALADVVSGDELLMVYGRPAWDLRYSSWGEAGGLGRTVGAFVDGAANFLKAMHIPAGLAVALIGVLVASFAGTTLDTATRLQRYVIQELAGALLPRRKPNGCPNCDYDLSYNVSGTCPECGAEIDASQRGRLADAAQRPASVRPADDAPVGRALNVATGTATTGRGFMNPIAWLTNKYVATLAAVLVAAGIAALPAPGAAWSWDSAGTGGMILWPMFGAVNQLMGGLAFLVIAFWLWRRRKPIWFLVLPLIFMLVIPAWAMLWQVFVEDIGGKPAWWFSDAPNWPLIGIALATLVLEAWMIVEALLLFPKVRGVLETPENTGSAPGNAAGSVEAGVSV